MVIPRDYDACGATRALWYQKLGKNRRENEGKKLASGQGKILQHN